MKPFTFLQNRMIWVKIHWSIGLLFSKISKACAKKPWTIIGVVVMIVLICGTGWARFKIETEDNELYAPRNSQAMKDRDFVSSHFGIELEDTTSTVYIVSEEQGTNILNQDHILALFDFYNQIEQISESKEQLLCAPNYANGECIKEGILAYWNWNRTHFEIDSDFISTVNEQNVPDCCSTSTPFIQQSLIMSGTSMNEQGKVISAEAFRMSFQLHTELEESFIKTVQQFTYNGLRFLPENEYARVTASNDAISGDLFLISLAGVLLTSYSCFVMSRWHPVESHAYLGVIAVIGVGLAIFSGYGLVIACGVPFSLVVNSVIFVAMGLGVDDAFVIMDAVSRQRTMRGHTVEETLSKAMCVAGSSITLTSVTDFVAFMVGSTTKIPALSAFAYFAGVTIFVDYLIQVTFFPAVVALDLKRQQEHRFDTLCCFKENYESSKNQQNCCCKYFNKGGSKSFAQRIIGDTLPKIILHPMGKIMVMLSAIVLLSGGIYGVMNLEMEFKTEWLVPDGNFLHDTWQIRRQYFEKGYMPVFLYTKEVKSGYFHSQDQIQSLIDEINNLDYVLSPSVSFNWYDQYQLWLGNEAAGQFLATNDSYSYPISQESFIVSLKSFLNTTSGQYFKDSIIFNTDQTAILATSMLHLWVVENTGASVLIENMQHERSTISDAAPDLHPIIYADFFPVLEGLAILQFETFRNIMIACSTVFVICLFILSNLRAAGLVLLMLLMIDTCLLGSLWWIGEYLNIVTSIILIVSIGLSVDYCAHIAHSFMHAEHGTRNERAAEALRHIGHSVLNGGLSSFIGILVGAAATHYIFKIFFRMIVMIVLLGLYFGMVVLPVILSLFGPPSRERENSSHFIGASIVRKKCPVACTSHSIRVCAEI